MKTTATISHSSLSPPPDRRRLVRGPRAAVAHSYYHVYSKGARNRSIFIDESDYIVFLALLKQYVRLQKLMNALEHPPVVRQSLVRLHAYSLTTTTFQLILQQSADPTGIDTFMHAVIVSYTSYYNHKYRCSAVLFSDVYKATIVSNSHTLVALSQAMHTQPATWRQSSRAIYLGTEQVDWLQSTPIVQLAGGRKRYQQGLNQSRVRPIIWQNNRGKNRKISMLTARK